MHHVGFFTLIMYHLRALTQQKNVGFSDISCIQTEAMRGLAYHQMRQAFVYHQGLVLCISSPIAVHKKASV